MRKIKTVLIVAASLLAAAGFCVYKVYLDEKMGHHSEIKSESLCEKENKKYCLNGGECFYLVDGDNVACNCTWLYGRKRCEKYMWCTQVNYSSLKSNAL